MFFLLLALSISHAELKDVDPRGVGGAGQRSPIIGNPMVPPNQPQRYPGNTRYTPRSQTIRNVRRGPTIKALKPNWNEVITKSPSKQNECRLFATKWSVAGWNDNEFKYLNNHPIRCPKNYALKYVRLFSDKSRAKFNRGAWSMRFKFICCRIKAINCEQKASKTQLTTNSYTLARIGNIKCGCEKVMTSIHIQTFFDKKYQKFPISRVGFSCCNFYQHGLKKFKVVKKTTGYQGSGNGRNVFLDRHNINCGRKGFISSFRAKTKTKNITGINPLLKFNYTCVIPILKGQSKLTRKAKEDKIMHHAVSIQRLLGMKVIGKPRLKINLKKRKVCMIY